MTPFRLRKYSLCLGLLLGLPSLVSAQAPTPPAASATPAPKSAAPPNSYPERSALWEKDIAGFEARDKADGAPASGGIVFVGSSSIVKWKTLAEDFPGLPVIARGFGGSLIQDSTYFSGRIVLPYQPRIIVFYAGDNDIAAGNTVEQVVGDFQTFAKKVRGALPTTKILFLAIKPSPSRWRYQPQITAANQAIAAWIASQKEMGFVDVHTPMLGSDGQPRQELYVSDKLHLSADGYKLWKGILAPYLK